MEHTLKCPYIKKTIAECPFISKHISSCPHLDDPNLEKAPSDQIDLKGFYTDAKRCPYMQKTFKSCPFIHNQLVQCPFFKDDLDTEQKHSETDDNPLQPISIFVNDSGLLIPNMDTKNIE